MNTKLAIKIYFHFFFNSKVCLISYQHTLTVFTTTATPKIKSLNDWLIFLKKLCELWMSF